MELFDFIFTALILRFALAYRASNKIANDEIRYWWLQLNCFAGKLSKQLITEEYVLGSL